MQRSGTGTSAAESGTIMVHKKSTFARGKSSQLKERKSTTDNLDDIISKRKNLEARRKFKETEAIRAVASGSVKRN